MNLVSVVKELEKTYPDKKIIFLPEDNPSEILCEVEPSSEHPEYSRAIAVIDKSAVHYHKISTEVYKVMRGELHLFLNGKVKLLHAGEEYQIDPRVIHWAEGNGVWVETYSTPGWTSGDHILVGKEEEIHISPYDPAWPVLFEEEKKKIDAYLGNRITGGVHHVGSTAVPELSAKPIIDIMAGFSNPEEAKPCINLLESIGYQYFPYKSEEMYWFCKPSLEHRTHHLHLVEFDGIQWKARLAFRDYLRTHPETRQAYEVLKVSLAEKYKDDREAYTEAKTAFIKQIVQQASGA